VAVYTDASVLGCHKRSNESALIMLSWHSGYIWWFCICKCLSQSCQFDKLGSSSRSDSVSH